MTNQDIEKIKNLLLNIDTNTDFIKEAMKVIYLSIDIHTNFIKETMSSIKGFMDLIGKDYIEILRILDRGIKDGN